MYLIFFPLIITDTYPLVISSIYVYTYYICGLGVILSGHLGKYILLDPKLAVASISEVPGASKAYLDVE